MRAPLLTGALTVLAAAAVAAPAATAAMAAPPAVVAPHTTAGPALPAAATFRVVRTIGPGTIPWGQAKGMLIRWAGPARFPVRIRMVPRPGCGSGFVGCSRTGRLAHRRRVRLRFWWGCPDLAGDPPATMLYRVQLVDAAGRRTRWHPFRFSCG